MKTRNLCVGMMMTGISLLAFSCSKQDQNELLNSTNSKGAAPAATPTPLADDVPQDMNWTRVRTNIFSVQIPNDWNLKEMNGMDTYNGILQGPKSSMHYEYGKMNQPYQIDDFRFTYQYERIDGKMAKIISARTGGQYGICIDSARVMRDNAGNVTRVMGFMLMSTEGTPIDRNVALTIIRSVDLVN